ncbi:MAG: glycosyltransferase family 39 protein [Dehalococcoidia bacterium]|nr:glycosyltransferase family 39 protein [Dehalococcoidia bacterium]
MRALPFPHVSRRAWQLEGLRVPALALWLGGITLGGFLLRLIWVFYTDTIPLGGDPHWYYVVAVNLAQGYGFVTAAGDVFMEVPGPGEPTAFWPPAYPFALAGVYKLFGIGFTSAKVYNALLGALTIPFVYLLAREIFDKRTGLFAAAAFAVFPNAIAWTPLLFPEEQFVLVFVAALWVLVAFPQSETNRWLPLAAFGVLVGIATLTRGQGAALIPIAGLYWLLRSGWRPALQSTGIALVATAAVIAPWTVRNAFELDAFVPISTNSGAALRAGHAPDSIGTTKWTEDAIGGVRMDQSLQRPDWEVRGYRVYTRRAIEYAVSHPREELDLTRYKVYHLYRSDAGVLPWLETVGATPIEPRALKDTLWVLFDVSYYGVLFAALLTIPFWLRRDPKRLLLVNVVLMWTAFHIIFEGEPRYHVPLFPILIIAAAAGALAALAAVRAVIERRPPGHQRLAGL